MLIEIGCASVVDKVKTQPIDTYLVKKTDYWLDLFDVISMYGINSFDTNTFANIVFYVFETKIEDTFTAKTIVGFGGSTIDTKGYFVDKFWTDEFENVGVGAICTDTNCVTKPFGFFDSGEKKRG